MLSDIMTNVHNIQNKKAGNLTVFAGPMRAKKSGLLIEEIWQLNFTGLKVAAFIHSRSRDSEIASRMSSKKFPAIKIDNAFECFNHITPETEVVAIDEAQFFGDDIITVVKLLINAGKDIYISGLDMNWKGEPFGAMGSLLAMADDVVKMKTVCCVPHCPLARYATKTTFTLAEKDVSAPTNFVADEKKESEVYYASCNLHWRFQLKDEERKMIESLSEEIREKIKQLEKINSGQ